MADVLLTSTEEVIQLVSVSGSSTSDITSAVNAHALLATGVHGVGVSTVDSVAARDAAINAHNASALAHGLTANNWDALQGDALPLILGTPGSIDGEIVLGSDNREDFAFTVFQADFGGNPDPVLFHGYNPPNSTGYNSAEQSIYTGYEGYYWIGAAEQYAEWYVEYKNPGATVTRRPFQTSIRLNTNIVNTYIYADNLVIGSGDGLTNYWQILSGVASFSLPVYITGVSDAVQCVIKGYSTQTNYIFQIQDSNSNNLLYVKDDGIIRIDSTTPANSQDWMIDHEIESGSAGADVYMYGHRLFVLRDNGGPAFSWTYGFNATVSVRALTANATSRYAYAGHYEITVQANNTFTAQVSVSANVIESRLTKSGAGTAVAVAPHGIDIGDMGGTGSYTPAAVYIAAQTTPTSGAPYAIQSLGGRVLLAGLPTSAAGLASGELWNNSNVINIVP